MRVLVRRLIFLAGLLLTTHCGTYDEPVHSETLKSTDLNLTNSDSQKISLIFTVPGWGYTVLPFWQETMDRYASWFEEFNVPRKHIYQLDYPYMKDAETIEKAITDQMRSILSRYPANAKFDMIGHSLGAFAGMYGAVKGNFAGQMRQLVSLAGIPFGWNAYYCWTGICGQLDRALVPLNSKFVQNFHTQYKNEMSKFSKCSLYSPADVVIKPYDAGKFIDGKNVEVPNMRHLDVIKDKIFFYKMMDVCYQNDIGFN